MKPGIGRKGWLSVGIAATFSALFWLCLAYWATRAWGDTLTVSFTLPSNNATVLSCIGGAPLADLSAVALYGHDASVAGPPVLLRLKSALGREGQPDTLQVQVDAPLVLWVATRDTAGNWSCASDSLLLAPTDVTPPEVVAPPTASVTYDVQGRVVTPKRAGVYFRPGERPRSVRP